MSLKVIVIGGVAAGPKAASKIMRLNPQAEVTIIEKGKFISYAGCGLPYYVSGLVKEQKDLMSTPIGVLRDPAFFQKVKNVKVLTETEALEIDRAQKRVGIRLKGESAETWFDYDNLLLATGAKPVIPPLSNVALGNISTLHSVPDAEGRMRWPLYDCEKNAWKAVLLAGSDPIGKGKDAYNVSLGLVYDAKRKLIWAADHVANISALRLDLKAADVRPMEEPAPAAGGKQAGN